MKKNIIVIFTLILALMAACTPQMENNSENNSKDNSETKTQEESMENTEKKISDESVQEDNKIIGEDYDENGGADSYSKKGDNPDSLFYKHPDFFNMKSEGSLTIIPNFKTMQQTTEWSCGNATCLMVLEHLGVNNFTEMKLAEEMKSHTDMDKPDSKPGSANNFCEYGTDVSQLYLFLKSNPDVKIIETSYVENPAKDMIYNENDPVPDNDKGNIKETFYANSLYSSENAEETDKWVEDAKDSYFVKWLNGHLKSGRPIMVEWADWGGHWQAIIGYDNNGTPSIGDDTLIFADPYDTSDHKQDGYYVYPLERWFYMWNDRRVAPKPYQLQPYIIIDKN